MWQSLKDGFIIKKLKDKMKERDRENERERERESERKAGNKENYEKEKKRKRKMRKFLFTMLERKFWKTSKVSSSSEYPLKI